MDWWNEEEYEKLPTLRLNTGDIIYRPTMSGAAGYKAPAVARGVVWGHYERGVLVYIPPYSRQDNRVTTTIQLPWAELWQYNSNGGRWMTWW